MKEDKWNKERKQSRERVEKLENTVGKEGNNKGNDLTRKEKEIQKEIRIISREEMDKGNREY